MAFTARFYKAKEAQAMALSCRLPRQGHDGGAKTLAREIAANAPLAVQATKEGPT